MITWNIEKFTNVTYIADFFISYNEITEAQAIGWVKDV